jgi:hypothetical protein
MLLNHELGAKTMAKADKVVPMSDNTPLAITPTMKFSPAQLREMLKQAEAEQAALLTSEKKEKIIEEIEAYVADRWNGLSLFDLGLAEKKARKNPDPSFYKSPKTGKVYEYKGWGAVSKDVKEWLYKDEKRNEDYRCDKDGNPLKA